MIDKISFENYKAFEQGEIEKVIELLDTQKLENSYQQIRQRIAANKKLITIAEKIEEKSLAGP